MGGNKKNAKKLVVKSKGNIEISQKNISPKAKNRESDQENSDSESSPCAECDRDIYENDVALQCDLCDNWLCNHCLHISRSAYDLISKSKTTDGIMWFCSHCRISLPATKKLLQRLDDLESKQLSYERKMKELQINMEKKCKQNDQADNSPETIEKIDVASIVSQVLEEQNEREKRKFNVVCFGLPESQENSSEERRDDDKERIGRVIRDDIGLDDFSMVNEPIRLGRFNAEASKPRPVKFTVSSVEIKQKVVEGSRNKLRKSREERCKDLYFQSDLTANQRKEAYLQRVERRKNYSPNSTQRGRKLNSLSPERGRLRMTEGPTAAGATGSGSFQV